MRSYRQPGIVLTDHTFTVPVDHAKSRGATIELFAREIVAAEHAEKNLPWLLFLQGGPGMASPRPVGRESWLARALDEFRVLLLDQRGTGRSAPVNRRTLAAVGGLAEQAEYLNHFRADAIVRDAELVRRTLMGNAKWSVLGQSFGGFCATSYLSTAPEGLREAFITGGLPGLNATADDVYRATYPQVAAKTAAHYDRYPDDVDTVARVVEQLRESETRLPSSRVLTVEAFQSLGRLLGHSSGSHWLHYLLEDAFIEGDGLSEVFLAQVDNHLAVHATSPLYAILHEQIYAQGPGATRWSAQRIRSEFPEFDAVKALDSGSPVQFTGEMVYPWMLDIDPALWPLREVADRLAEQEHWPHLYDEDRLRDNEIPAAAAVYYDDMYVDRELSMQTARTIRGLRPWVTNEYEHNGVGAGNGVVLDRLIRMARGRI
jgi:pimeloyl-ACP methyl ester carboxylesterase